MSPNKGVGDILFLVRILLALKRLRRRDTFFFALYLMNW